MNADNEKTPVHFWVVGVLALLWDAMGAFDYAATQYRIESYMSQFTQAQLDYFYAFPAWADAAWALAVWSSLAGAVSLLLRRRWAVILFGAAIVGLAMTTVYNFILSDGLAVMGTGAAAFTVVIWAIALFLFFYARGMAQRGVLH